MSDRRIRRQLATAVAGISTAALLAACGGGGGNETSDTGVDASQAEVHTVQIEAGSFASGGLNQALYDDVGGVLEDDSNPWMLPAGTQLKILTCEPTLNEPGNSGGCTFAVKNESGGFALVVTTNSAGSAANWVAAGTAEEPGS